MKPNHFLYLGAENWVHPAWLRDFYPEGLPEDWLLSYYNTQFQTVYLPAAVWRQARPETWTQWLYDTQEGFVFIVEASPDSALPASERVRVATAAWQTAHVWWLDESADLRALSRRIREHAATGEELFILSRVGDLALLQQVKALREVLGY
ncbi:MAG: hypothetical protein LDL19_04450 [Thiobacillus sp.]|nr:hypothetical protein [Thiobacillus sp.]